MITDTASDLEKELRKTQNADSRSELERWYDEEYSKTVWPQSYVDKLSQLIGILKKERDAWKATAEANEKAMRGYADKLKILSP